MNVRQEGQVGVSSQDVVGYFQLWKPLDFVIYPIGEDPVIAAKG